MSTPSKPSEFNADKFPTKGFAAGFKIPDIVKRLEAPGDKIIAIDDVVYQGSIIVPGAKTPFMVAIIVGPDCKSGIRPGDRYNAESTLGIDMEGVNVKVSRDDRVIYILPHEKAPEGGISAGRRVETQPEDQK